MIAAIIKKFTKPKTTAAVMSGFIETIDKLHDVADHQSRMSAVHAEKAEAAKKASKVASVESTRARATANRLASLLEDTNA